MKYKDISEVKLDGNVSARPTHMKTQNAWQVITKIKNIIHAEL